MAPKGVQNGRRCVCKHYKQRAKSIRISNESERTIPSHLSIYRRERIIALWEEGKTVSEILATLETEGRRTSRATVRRWVFRWRTNRGLRDQHRCGRKSKFTTEIAIPAPLHMLLVASIPRSHCIQLSQKWSAGRLSRPFSHPLLSFVSLFALCHSTPAGGLLHH